MSVTISSLLPSRMHIRGAVFEDYILGLVDDPTRRAVETHLNCCKKCRDEIDSATNSMYEPLDEGLHQGIGGFDETVSGSTAVSTNPFKDDFVWEVGTTFWLNDASYSIQPIQGHSSMAKVENLTLWQLQDKKAQDDKEPGTWLVGIEGNGIKLIFPLSKLTEMKLALAAGSGGMFAASGGASSVDSRDRTVISRRLFRYSTSDLTLDILTNERESIFLNVCKTRSL